jgi:hypothetical protein
MNLTDYNARVWALRLAQWFGEEDAGFRHVVDIGAGSGRFLGELLERLPGAEGTAVDIKPTPAHPRYRIHLADIHESGSLSGLAKTCLLCCMNTLYVLRSVDEILAHVAASGVSDIVLSIPLERAIERYNRRHPGKNNYAISAEQFLETAGFVEYRAMDTIGVYYLDNPLAVVGGGMSNGLASLIESVTRKRYYRLIWAKRGW